MLAIQIIYPVDLWLWFASFLLTLHNKSQHLLRGSIQGRCCDLLLFYYLCTINLNTLFVSYWLLISYKGLWRWKKVAIKVATFFHGRCFGDSIEEGRLEEFELHCAGQWLCPIHSFEYFDVSELSVGNCHYAYFPLFRKNLANSIYVYLSILHARAWAHIYGKLKHCKSIGYKSFAEIGICFPLCFRLCRQIKEYHYPHNLIFV